MKKTKTPKWLINGAVNQWMGPKGLVLFAFFIVLLVFTSGAVVNCTTTFLKTGDEGDVALQGFVLGGIGAVVAFLGFLIVGKIARTKIGNSEKWQRKYLQSRIDEHNSYLLVAENCIKQAAANYESIVNSIEKNKQEMKNKADQAENYLIMNFT